MKKLPVAGPTYDYKLENIRNSIIEEELALCLKKRENVYLDEDVQVKYTDASGTEHTFGQVTADTVSLQTDVTTLQSNFTTLDGEVTANASAVSGLETRVTSAEGTITANSTSITSLQSDLTTLDGEVTANASAVSSLDTRVTTAEGSITAQASDITTLQSDLTSAEGDITATATAVSSLDTRVTTAEGNITSQASSITTLQSDLSALDTDVTANASAVSTLQTSVSVIDGEVTAISSDVTSLTTTVGDNTTDITTNASSINGIEGKYSVKIDNNGYVSGFGLISTANDATPFSTFTITADAFKIVDTSSGTATPYSPFKVYTSSRTVDGVTVPAGVYIEDAFITSAEIKTLNVDVINLDGVTLDTSNGELIVKSGGIDTTQIAGSAVSGVSTSYTISASVPYDTSAAPSTTIATVSSSANSGDKFLGIVTTGWYSNLNSNIDYINQRGFLGGSLQQVQLFHPSLHSNASYAGGSTLVGIYTATSSGTVNLDFRPTQTQDSSASVTANQIRLALIRLKR